MRVRLLHLPSWGAGPTYPVGASDGASAIDDYIGQLRARPMPRLGAARR